MSVEMVRPDWDVIAKASQGAYLYCNCGAILQTFGQGREHWQMGHFDYVKKNIDPKSQESCDIDKTMKNTV